MLPKKPSKSKEQGRRGVGLLGFIYSPIALGPYNP